MSEPEIEYVYVRLRRSAAIRVPVTEIDSYLAQGYMVIPIRDEPVTENS